MLQEAERKEVRAIKADMKTLFQTLDHMLHKKAIRMSP